MNLKRLEKLVEIYKRKNKPKIDKLLNSYKNSKSLEEVVKNAALGKGSDGKRHPHQRRLKQEVLEKVKNNLLKRKQEISDCKDFRNIINIVSESSVKGFGKLAIYDTSLRIGANRNVYPLEVYIHAGARKGCKALGVSDKVKTLPVQAFPQPIKVLQPHEIEDFLCIYKDNLRNLR